MQWTGRQRGFNVFTIGDDPYPKLTVFRIRVSGPTPWAAIVHESAKRVHWVSERFPSREAAQAAALREARHLLAREWHDCLERALNCLALAAWGAQRVRTHSRTQGAGDGGRASTTSVDGKHTTTGEREVMQEPTRILAGWWTRP